MPKVSTKQVQRRIDRVRRALHSAEAPRGLHFLRSVAALIILAIIAAAAFSSANRTPFDFSPLT